MVRSPTARLFDDEMWAVLRTNPRRVCERNVAVVGSKTERKAARALVAAYHEARLADLIQHVAEELDRYRDGEVDADTVDETIHQYHRAAQELWKFCWSGGVGANIEIVARTLQQLTEAGETVDWWSASPPTDPDAVNFDNAWRQESLRPPPYWLRPRAPTSGSAYGLRRLFALPAERLISNAALAAWTAQVITRRLLGLVYTASKSP